MEIHTSNDCCFCGGPAGMMLDYINAIPLLRRIPAYLVGIGVRPEHIKTLNVLKTNKNPAN